MAYMPKYSGLCETCDHDPTCMLRRSTQLEIIQCEEFSIQTAAYKPPSVPVETMIADPAIVTQMGLCANCLNVVSCGFPGARHSVLQCEEYLLDESGVIPPVRAERSKSAA
jgi:hypothetical protein